LRVLRYLLFDLILGSCACRAQHSERTRRGNVDGNTGGAGIVEASTERSPPGLTGTL
jgi:hypothetical protein